MVLDAEENLTTTLHDALGRPYSHTDAEGHTTTSIYDAASRLLAAVNPRGYATSFSYDGAGRKLTETDPLGRVTTLSYDGVGNRTLRVNARSQAVTYTYSGNRELIGEQYPGGRVHTFTYDGAGNRTHIADATGVTTLVYDSRNLLESVTNPDGKSVAYGYSRTRQRTGMVDPEGGVTTYGYNNADRLDWMANPQGKLTTLAYDVNGRRVRIEHANGSITTYAYNCADRVTRIEHRNSDDTLVNLTTYTYDNVGNRTRAVESSGEVTSWTYDDTYQVTHEVRSGSHSFDVTYTYDEAGNRVTEIDSGAVTTYTYNAANELLTAQDACGSTSYCYDGDGNRTCKDAPSETIYYEWDEDSRLTVAEPPAGKTTLTYRGDGRRVRKETPSDTTKFIYDGNRLLEETDGSDDPQRQYTSTLDQWGELISEYDGSDTAYHLADALGSTDALLDDDESATDRYQYRAFGVQSQQGSHESPFTFVGAQNYYRDSDLELYYAGARYYDPAAGRWLSQDPIGFEPGDSNLYRYVHNNPVNETDPSGLQSLPLRYEDWSDWKSNFWNPNDPTSDPHYGQLAELTAARFGLEDMEKTQRELDRYIKALAFVNANRQLVRYPGSDKPFRQKYIRPREKLTNDDMAQAHFEAYVLLAAYLRGKRPMDPLSERLDGVFGELRALKRLEQQSGGTLAVPAEWKMMMDLKDAEGRWKAAYDRVVKGHTDWDQFKQWLADPDTSNTIVMGFSGFAGVGPTGENVRDYVQPPPRAERAWVAPLKPLAHEGPLYPGNRPAGESPPRGAPPECVPPRLPKAAMDAGRPAGRIVGEGVAPGKVGEYTTKIKWGIHDIDARPHGSGYWGKRIPQNDARVDAFELKINPNNESYYLPHPEGGFVQFENLSATALQDGKLIIKPKSIYHVDDLPAFAKNKVIAEAQRQVAAGKKAGLPVEWLVSDQKAVTQLDKLFKSEGIPISVKHFPE